MAQKVLVEILDDIDGSAATQTVQFGLDGVTYEIDLSDENATTLRDELARFVGAGRRVGGRKVRVATGQSTTTTVSDRERNQQIRAWANANGYAVSERGRLSSEVVSAFEQAQVAETETPAPRKRSSRKKAAA
ncbi:Lsr2 family protein [Amycolatopsis balhimycina DSM 5908]|uniref:Lsr2 family protein n=1 Tax=Amycolatopsis balhimycina DSM 5908 TaxID=1081091 RepID=A0A428WRW4_AMYBA|nr:Lsr2 family protein [Amycolatopsis balhimycina]RSM45773.1 Lsr2 family protein [Amycolatopsis balhimycina DSM 5908]